MGTDKQPISMQLELARNIFKNMKDVKKCPAVVALTKFDKVEQNEGLYPDPNEEVLREDEVVKQGKDFFKSPGLKKVLKKQEIHVIETSSEKNVNIEATFHLIASLVDKRRSKENKQSHKSQPEVKPYRE